MDCAFADLAAVRYSFMCAKLAVPTTKFPRVLIRMVSRAPRRPLRSRQTGSARTTGEQSGGRSTCGTTDRAYDLCARVDYCSLAQTPHR